MFSMLKAIVNFVWRPGGQEEDEDVDDVDQLQDRLEKMQERKIYKEKVATDQLVLKQGKCTKAFGKVTSLMLNQTGYIDEKYYFDSEIRRPANMKDGDTVEYLSYRMKENDPLRIAEILSVVDAFHTDLDLVKNQMQDYEIGRRIVVAKVIERIERTVVVSEKNIRFNLDTITANFIPVVGDWVEVYVKMQEDDEDLSINDGGTVLEVEEVRSLRNQTLESKVTHWDNEGEFGTIDNKIFFSRNSSQTGYCPTIGDVVAVDAIESDQGKLTWRAISVVLLKKQQNFVRNGRDTKVKQTNENRNGIVVTDSLNFGMLNIGEIKELEVQVVNNSSTRHKLIKGIFQSRKCDSQIKVVESPPEFFDLTPGQKVKFVFKCTPSLLGYSEENYVFKFKDFQIKRSFKIYVIDVAWEKVDINTGSKFSERQQKSKFMEKIKNVENCSIVPGIRLSRPPPFIAVRHANYDIPQKLWNIMYDLYHLPEGVDQSTFLENSLPLLSMPLSFENYIEKSHLLMHLEELQQTIGLREYDIPSTFLQKDNEFLSLEIEGLSENRPSIIIGDSIRVRNAHDSKSQIYEGIIHQTSANRVFAKFSLQFHQNYNGEDLSVEFRNSRGRFIKPHIGIDLAVKHLGREVLFPDQLRVKPPQVDIVDLEQDAQDINCNKPTKTQNSKEKNIKWITPNLNSVQKYAVKNALMGVARPLPYVIFGPPGTGKTITLVEFVLQVLCLIPDSRILVCTPSNSSADLFTERLIETADLTSGTLMRIIAHHVASSGNVSERLRPYCTTVDISMEMCNTRFKTQYNDKGIKCNTNRTNIGRHRITVGTCSVVGNLFKLGFPEGHFTHIVVDEAGQAMEPEAMIPLAFVDKCNGQAILAGDPMQLGPVIICKYAREFGLGESFLERLLKCYPYLRDPQSFTGDSGGYDPRLVTRLVYNYRSIPKILALPSSLFYNSSLIPQVKVEDGWVKEVLSKIVPALKLDSTAVFPGLIFYGVRGVNMRGLESPSWFNPHEASTVAILTSKLFRNGITPNEIGIVTPYIQQIKFIRTLFSEMDLEMPKIGSVEEFQGQERRIIIMSTVRSSETEIQKDVSFYLGFVKNPKRLNVCLTRPQVMLIIVGNPHLLLLDSLWKRVIEYAHMYGLYMGCDLPLKFLKEHE